MAKRPENGKVGGDIGIELKHQLDEHLEKHGGNRSEFIKARIEEHLNRSEATASSPDVEQLQTAIKELREEVRATHMMHQIIRQDIAEFMKVILLNHREFFGEAKLTEEKVQALLEEMFP